MHFNRTQFVVKTQVRMQFFAAILMLVSLTSSCDEFIDFGPGLWSNNGPAPSGKVTSVPTLYLDSVRYDSINVYRICSSIRYDSTLVLTGFGFNYSGYMENHAGQIRDIVVDTIHFALRGAYLRKTRIRDMKPNTTYTICGSASYLVGKDTLVMSAPCVSFTTN